MVKNHFADERWREVFLLTAEMLDNADEFIEFCLSELNRIGMKSKVTIKLLQIADEEYTKIKTDDKEYTKRAIILYILQNISKNINYSENFDATIYKKSLFLYDIFRNTQYYSSLLPGEQIVFMFSKNSLSAKISIDYILLTLSLKIQQMIEKKKYIMSRERYFEGTKDTFEEIIKEINQNKISEFDNVITKIKFPNCEDSIEKWNCFAESIIKTIKNYRDWDIYSYDFYQDNNLKEYLYCTSLIHEFLKVSYVSDRSKIENNLLKLQ